jgi:hypothetical protein
MIPDFQEDGYLPVGIHQATLDEVAQRFGIQSEIRQVQIESLRWLVELAVRAGALRLVVNGSFVTSEPEPNDVDCVLLIDENFPRDALAEAELLDGLPFLDIEIVTQEGFDFLVETAFASDRHERPKGMIEILL